jgi:hypothetical protein
VRWTEAEGCGEKVSHTTPFPKGDMAMDLDLETFLNGRVAYGYDMAS